ncbi:MAG: DinB family protein [Chloroflexi bacterium]|nr:DinB family protein [Chloroflexota bacterium]
MTALEQIRALYEYNEWANDHVLAAASGLSEEELGRKLGASFESVQGNLRHTLGAQVMWLARWTGSGRAKMPELDKVRTLDAISEGYASSHEELRRFVGSLGEGDIARAISYVDIRGNAYERPLGPLMTHVVNHGTHHRAETAMALTALGKPPRQLDYLYFELERA